MTNHPNRPKRSRIIIVNDGQYRWGADRAELLGWLRLNDWTIEGSYVEEPEYDGEDLSEAPYNKMCQDVLPVAGYEPEHNCAAWDDLPHLTVWPSDGPRVWHFG